jgi:D-cysteine desulfhydrase
MNFTPDQILVNDDAIQPGYAVMTDLEKNAMQVFARKAAIFLDPVYTGRAAGVLIQLIQKGEFQKDETVLFWHTGGLPALFADPYTKNLI